MIILFKSKGVERFGLNKEDLPLSKATSVSCFCLTGDMAITCKNRSFSKVSSLRHWKSYKAAELHFQKLNFSLTEKQSMSIMVILAWFLKMQFISIKHSFVLQASSLTLIWTSNSRTQSLWWFESGQAPVAWWFCVILPLIIFQPSNVKSNISASSTFQSMWLLYGVGHSVDSSC